MPTTVDAQSTLSAVLAQASPHQDLVIHTVAIRAGLCGDLAVEAADEVPAGAEHYSNGHASPVIAEEIIADVEARARICGGEVNQ